MGTRGPMPKRSDQRRRNNKPEQPIVKAPAAAPPERPEPDPEWHPIATMWFESLGKSGQSAFYESSDWVTAYSIAESMSREFHPQPIVLGRGGDARVEMFKLPPKASSLASWLKGMSGLLVLEGDRRRAGLELQRSTTGAEEASGDVSWIDDARTRLRDAN